MILIHIIKSILTNSQSGKNGYCLNSVSLQILHNKAFVSGNATLHQFHSKRVWCFEMIIVL